MIIALDVGNSHIYGGVFDLREKLAFQFRKSTQSGQSNASSASSDEIGLFLRGVLRENNLDPTQVRHVSICSVVPSLDHTLRNCSIKYFGINPFFLQPGVKTGLKIQYRNPIEVGADRIANAVAATQLYPGEDLILIDFGTATTLCAVSADKSYLGGAILAGVGISAHALSSRTAKLPAVEIVVPPSTLGRATVESIQSGVYYGHIGAAKELTRRISDEVFGGSKPRIIGTGGFASMFANTGVFDVEAPDLVLQGLLSALKLNL